LGVQAFAVEREGISEEAAVNDAFTSETSDIRNARKRFTASSNRGMRRKRYCKQQPLAPAREALMSDYT